MFYLFERFTRTLLVKVISDLTHDLSFCMDDAMVFEDAQAAADFALLHFLPEYMDKWAVVEIDSLGVAINEYEIAPDVFAHNFLK